MGQHLSHIQSEQIEYNATDYEFFQQFSNARIFDFIQQAQLPLSLELPSTSTSTSTRPVVEIEWKIYFQLFTQIETQLKNDSENSSRRHWHPATFMYAMERNTEEEVMYRPRQAESSSSEAERLPDAYTDDEDEEDDEFDDRVEGSEESRGARGSYRPARYSQEEYAQLSSERESSAEYEEYR